MHPDNTEHVVAFAFVYTLSYVKKNSTVEKEALAWVWAVERSRTYLWGRQFTLRTESPSLNYASADERYEPHWYEDRSLGSQIAFFPG